MRTIILLFGLAVFGLEGYSQQSDVPMLNFIYRLRDEVKQNVQEKERLQNLVSVYLTQLDIEKKKNQRDDNKISSLYEDLNKAKDLFYRLTNINSIKQDSLRYAYSIIDTLKTNNTELQKIVAEYKLENLRVKKESDKKTATVFDLQRDAELLAIMLSKFNTYEIGYIKNGKLEVNKIYDNATISSDDKGISFRNPEIFSNKLNVLNYTGMLCVPKNKSFGQNVSGELLIYVNEKLAYRLKEKLKIKIDNNISSVECYEIDSRQKVDFSFPSKANIRVGFVDDATLKNLTEDDFSNFWESDEKGYFKISSLKPSYKLNTLPDSTLIKNSVIIDSIYVTGSKLFLDFYDNGYDDGDIASFYVNGFLKVEKLFLKSTGTRIPLTLKEDTNIFTLISNSQGDEPPCTAYVVIYENDTRRGAITLSGSQFKTHSLKIIRTNK